VGVPAVLAAVILGGLTAGVAVLIYLVVALALWGLFTLVWRVGPTPATLRDMI
jgi:hypothetical protein